MIPDDELMPEDGDEVEEEMEPVDPEMDDVAVPMVSHDDDDTAQTSFAGFQFLHRITLVLQCSFQVSTVRGTWFEHNQAAIDIGCNLASILSIEEQAMVMKKTEDVDSIVWIGGKFIGDGDMTAGLTGPEYWMWTDGSTWDFEDWGYPNGPTGRGECIKIRPFEESGGKRDWNDEDCNRMRPAIYKCCN